jgi:hypothetical protein
MIAVIVSVDKELDRLERNLTDLFDDLLTPRRVDLRIHYEDAVLHDIERRVPAPAVQDVQIVVQLFDSKRFILRRQRVKVDKEAHNHHTQEKREQ